MESSGEGVDPLESLDKTLLNIAGNSTSLARWDARLGRQNEPFVAGLSSLSVDGGAISLMDVVIDKLFPVAYTSGERGKGDAPWNEEEELLLQDQWTVSDPNAWLMAGKIRGRISETTRRNAKAIRAC